MGLLVFVLPLIAIVTVVTTIIYKNAFDRHTTKVLTEGAANKRKWIAPWGFALILLGAQLVLVAGIMFPLSMFMVNTDVGFETVIGDEEPVPLTFDYNLYGYEYVHEDDGCELVGEGSEDLISCKMYKKDNKDGTVTVYLSGRLDKWEMGTNLELNIEDQKGTCFAMATCGSVHEDAENVFFELSVITDEYTAGTIEIRLTDPADNQKAPLSELKMEY